MSERRSYTIPEFGRRHNLSRTSVYREHAEGDLEFLKIGSSTRITTDAEERWLGRKRAKTAALREQAE